MVTMLEAAQRADLRIFTLALTSPAVIRQLRDTLLAGSRNLNSDKPHLYQALQTWKSNSPLDPVSFGRRFWFIHGER